MLVVGLSHRTTPVALLEQAAVTGDSLGKLLHDVARAEHVAEALVLSTCNRVELYADVDKFHAGVAELSDLLAQHSGIPLEALTPHLYVHYEDRAVQHLFAVACGLDSMVVGESQILGQVKVALRLAQDQGTVGRVLNELAQQALRVGKRARTETGIDRAGASLVAVGLDVAERVLDGLAGRRAVVVGAGSMSALAAAALRRRGVADLAVVNRTVENAERLAQAVGARPLHLEQLNAEYADADVVVSCTGATGTVVHADALSAARPTAGERPLFVLDLALPRDVDPAIRRMPHVTVVDLETLADTLRGAERAADVEAVRAIVAAEVAGYLGGVRAARVAPTVVALRAMASDVVEAELVRLSGRLPALDSAVRREVELTVRRVVDKLLHAPTVRVKELADEPGGRSYAEALHTLFDLDPKTVEAVTRADATGPGNEAGGP